jgi:hypothetical protein
MVDRDIRTESQRLILIHFSVNKRSQDNIRELLRVSAAEVIRDSAETCEEEASRRYRN